MAFPRASESNILKQPVALPPHAFSPGMVESMKAFGSTILPSLPLPQLDSGSRISGDLSCPHPCVVDAVSREVTPAIGAARESRRLYDSLYGEARRAGLEAMYALDVNTTTIADDTLCLMQARLKPDAVLLVRLVLWLLSTALGTFLLFGRPALANHLPFLLRFGQLSLQQRERCLRSWATSRLYVFRTVFKVLKASFLATAGSKVDERLSNPLWGGIGYVAPDPERVTAEELTDWRETLKGGEPQAAPARASAGAADNETNGHGIGDCEGDGNSPSRKDHNEGGADAQKPGLDSRPRDGDGDGDGGKGSHGEVKIVRERPLDFAVVNAAEEEVRGAAALSAALAGKGVSVLEEQRTTAGLVQGVGGKLGVARTSSPSPLILSCDAVVVGSGCGGAVMAAALAQAMEQSGGEGREDGDGDGTGEKKKKKKRGRVLVMEAGGYFEGKDFSLLEGPSMAELYESSGLLATVDGGVSLLAGRCVGGGSTVNWSASFRTPPHVIKEWAEEYGLKQFAGEEYKAAMDAVCQRISVQSDSSLTEHNLSNSVLKAGCIELGYHHAITPRNVKTNHTCGSCTFGCRTGEKQGMPQTFLLDAAHHGAVILSRCKALRVITTSAPTAAAAAQGGRKRKVVGLEAEISPPDWFPVPRRKIIIEAPLVVAACGSIQTPALLLRSGLKNKHIGGRIRLHPVSGVYGYFPEGASLSPPPQHDVPISPLPSFHGAHMTANSTVVANWDTTGYGAMIQTPICHPGILLSSLPFLSVRTSKDLMARFHRLALLIAIVRDQGHGRVTIDSSEGEPELHYTMSKEDADSLMDGIICALRMQRAAGAFEVGTNQSTAPSFWTVNKITGADGSVEFQTKSDEEFEEYLHKVKKAGCIVNDIALFSAHQTGSCPMGLEASNSAADNNGELWEVSGLFLGDGSVFPTPVGVNPMLSIESVAYLLGHRLSRRFAKGEFK